MMARGPTDYQPSHEPRGFWDKTWKDEHGRRVLFQWPNLWFTLWAICKIVAILVSSKTAASVLGHLAAAVLVIWALLEIFRGANYFRRGLGLVVLLLTVASQLRAIL